MRRHNHNPFAVMSDILALVVMSSLMMVAMLILVAHTESVKHEGIKPDAQYLVTLTWDDKRDVDLDLWMKDPAGNIIYYGNRDDVNVSLDRDSRGFLTNRSIDKDGHEVISPNEEVISIRAKMLGEFLAAVGYYSGDGKPITFKVQIMKVNPNYTVVFNKEFTLNNPRAAINVVDFTINQDGSVSINMLPDKNLIDSYSDGGDGIGGR